MNFSGIQRLNINSAQRKQGYPRAPPKLPDMDAYTEEELEEYREVFSVFDTDGSGAIGTDELGEAMKSLGLATSEAELAALIHEVDADGNGEIDFEEFCACMKQMSERKETEEEVIRSCFRVFDQDKNGVVSETEFKVVMLELGGFDEQFISDFFREIDVAGNGQIDYHEFAQMVRTYLLDEEEKERMAQERQERASASNVPN